MSEPFRCPVCLGKGFVPSGFYSPFAVATTTGAELCQYIAELEQRLVQAEQQYEKECKQPDAHKFHKAETNRANALEQQVARLRAGLVYIRETPMPSHQRRDYINVLLAEGRDE